MRMLTPSAASSGPCPQTSPITARTEPSASCTVSKKSPPMHAVAAAGAVAGRRGESAGRRAAGGGAARARGAGSPRGGARRRRAGARCPWSGAVRSRTAPSARAARSRPRSWRGSPRRRRRPPRRPSSWSEKPVSTTTGASKRVEHRGQRLEVAGVGQREVEQHAVDPDAPGLERLGERADVVQRHRDRAPEKCSSTRSASPASSSTSRTWIGGRSGRAITSEHATGGRRSDVSGRAGRAATRAASSRRCRTRRCGDRHVDLLAGHRALDPRVLGPP